VGRSREEGYRPVNSSRVLSAHKQGFLFLIIPAHRPAISRRGHRSSRSFPVKNPPGHRWHAAGSFTEPTTGTLFRMRRARPRRHRIHDFAGRRRERANERLRVASVWQSDPVRRNEGTVLRTGWVSCETEKTSVVPSLRARLAKSSSGPPSRQVRCSFRVGHSDRRLPPAGPTAEDSRIRQFFSLRVLGVVGQGGFRRWAGVTF